MYSIKMIKNILIGWFNSIFDRNKKLSEERMEICNKCNEKTRITKNIYICGLCGCVLDSKTRVKDEKCELNKW